MTVVVGILNKQGVAIAADSAVTVSGLNNRKVYNSANKIFALSKYHPVGVAIYNSAQFMGIPWEVLIKEYRKQLEKKSFSKLSEYKDDFFNWLKEKNYFQSQSNHSYLFNDFLLFIQTAINRIENPHQIDSERIIEYLNNYMECEVPKLKKVDSLCKINKKKTLLILNSFIPKIIKILNVNIKLEFKEEDLKDILVNSYFEYLTHDFFLQFTGLIFTGYGEEELFPRLFPVNVSIVVNDLLRYKVDEQKIAEVGDDNESCIRPFAQTDVIDTILQGISPTLNKLSIEVFSSFISNFVEEIKAIEGMPGAVQNKLDRLNLSGYVQGYKGKIEYIIKNKYVTPLMGAVSQLSKEDLSEMAESLVYLTYLKRRFSMEEESVGGPVDIAIITKGDGLIWIKRKHYFSPDLNQSFFKKYF